MIYDNYILHSYNINLSNISSGSITILKNDGSFVTYTADNDVYSSLCNIYSQKCVEGGFNAWGYVYTSSYTCYLVMTNDIDFVKLENTSETFVDVSAHELDNNGNEIESSLLGADDYYLYLGQTANYFGNSIPTDTRYGFSYSGTIYQNQVTYFDLTYSWSPADSYYYNYQVKQFTYGSNNFYFYQQHLMFRRVPTISISYGSYISHVDIGYAGYQNGFNNGYNQGYTDGYNVGISLDRNTANAFSYIEQAFTAVGGIMSLEIIPHVTLGLCFSIPLVIVMITTIFKLVKK